MKNVFKKDLLLVFLLALMSGLFWSFVAPQPLVYDAKNYEQLGFNLAEGNGFSSSVAPPYAPAVNREPVYPFFISLIYRILGRHIEAVIIAQCLLHALTALLFYMLAEKISSRRIAIVAGVLIAIDPVLSGYCGYLLTETLTLFLLACFIFLLSLSDNRRRLLFAVSGGLLLGALTLCRAVFIFFPVFVIVYVFISGKFATLRFKALVASLLIISYLAVLSPWIYRNEIISGVPSVTTRSGILFLRRAMRAEYEPKDVLKYFVYSTSDTVGKKLFPDDYSRMTVWGMHGPDNVHKKAETRYDIYIAQGNSDMQTDRLLRVEAIHLIKDNLVGYGGQTFIEMWKLILFEMPPLLYSVDADKIMNASRDNYYAGMILRVTLRFAYSLLLVSCAVIASVRLKRRPWEIILPILYVVVTAVAVDVSTSRYFYPAIPFVIVLASTALVGRSDESSHTFSNCD